LEFHVAQATQQPASPLAQKIRVLIPELQAAVLATSDADAKAMRIGIKQEKFAEYVAASERVDQLREQFDALVTEAWATPVRSFDDAVLTAEIVQHKALDWVAHGESDGLLHPASEHDDEAVGRLVMAVLALARKPYTMTGAS
jgi:hypothetical protein